MSSSKGFHGLYRKQHGSSLAEFMLWGALAAGVVVIGIAGYKFSKAQSDTSRTGAEIRQLQAAIRTLTNGIYTSSTNYNSSLIAAKAVPGSMSTDASTGTITNGFGYPVTIIGGSTAGTVQIAYQGVPKEVCVQTLVDLNKTTWDSIQVDSGSAITSFPIDITTASAQCTAAYSTITSVGR